MGLLRRSGAPRRARGGAAPEAPLSSAAAHRTKHTLTRCPARSAGHARTPPHACGSTAATCPPRAPWPAARRSAPWRVCMVWCARVCMCLRRGRVSGEGMPRPPPHTAVTTTCITSGTASSRDVCAGQRCAGGGGCVCGGGGGGGRGAGEVCMCAVRATAAHAPPPSARPGAVPTTTTVAPQLPRADSASCGPGGAGCTAACVAAAPLACCRTHTRHSPPGAAEHDAAAERRAPAAAARVRPQPRPRGRRRRRCHAHAHALACAASATTPHMHA
jgi:hypothetical protein